MKIITGKIIAIFLCFCFIVPIFVSASTIQQLQDEQKQLQSRKDLLETQLITLKDDSSKADEYQTILLKKIATVEESILKATVGIEQLDTSIQKLIDDIDIVASKYVTTMDAFKARLRALYMAGDITTLQILLNSSTLHDFSLRMIYMNIISEYDQLLIEEMSLYINETKDKRIALSKQKDILADLKKGLEEDKNELNHLYEENKTLISTINSLKYKMQNDFNQLVKDDYSYTVEIAKLIEQAILDGTYVESQDSGKGDYTKVLDGVFNAVWPTPGFGTEWITQYYSEGKHFGIDIGAPYGSPIIAVSSGKVLSAQFADDWGNNILIYHNGTYTSRYAHMAIMSVSAGDEVVAGQIIGYVGSTGRSTGPHLHFEIYKDGTRLDPYPYITQ